MAAEQYPPHVRPGERVVLFDGVCRLCNGWVRFIIRHDRARLFKLAPVQSAQGQAILRWFGLPDDSFVTLLYVEGPELYVRSEAIARILRQLPAPWPTLAVFRFLPLVFRDWCYDRVARNRYRLFGRYDACLLPSPDHEGRFLDADR